MLSILVNTLFKGINLFRVNVRFAEKLLFCISGFLFPHFDIRLEASLLLTSWK